MILTNLTIEQKVDSPAKVEALQQVPTNQYIANAEFNEVVGKTNDVINEINNVQESIEGLSNGEGGKMYNTIAEVIALNPKPANGIVFQISASSDPTNAGYYTFQSASPNGFKFEKAFVNPSFSTYRTNDQLFNKADYILNTAVTSTGTLSSASSALNARTAKIAVDPTKLNVTLSGLQNLNASNPQHRWGIHDANGAVLSFGYMVTGATLALPAGATFLYVTYRHPNLDDNTAGDGVMVNYGTVALPRVDYTATNQLTTVNNAAIRAKFIEDAAVVENPGAAPKAVVNRETVTQMMAVTYEDIAYPNGTQLFDKNTYLENTTINNGALYTYPPVSSAQFARVMKISLDSTQTNLKVSGLQHLGTAAYHWLFKATNDTTILSSGVTTAEASTVISIPANAKYFYMLFRHYNLDDNNAGDNVMLNYGTTALPYAAFVPPTIVRKLKSVGGASIVPEVGDLSTYALKTFVQQFLPYYGKKLCTIGDSITRGLTWQPKLAQLTGMNFNSSEVSHATTPLGVPGSMVKPITTGLPGQNAGQSIYYRADYVKLFNPDVIIIMGGQNDGRDASYNLSDPPYTGDEVNQGDVAAPSFVSAYKGTLIKLITQNPTAKLVAMTPMYTGSTPYNDALMASYKLKNDTIKELCRMYSVQCIDLMSGVGISTYNSTTYYSDGTHPNLTGGEMIARTAAGQLN